MDLKSTKPVKIKTDRSKSVKIDTGKWEKEHAFNTDKVHTESLSYDMHKDTFIEHLHACKERGKKERKGDFFVIVLSKREPLLPTAIRNFFLHRKTCPTPNYEQIVYQYIRDEDALHEVWVIPDKQTCLQLKSNPLEAALYEKELLQYVLDLADGTLDERMRVLNGEKKFTLELEDEKKEELKKEV